MDYNFDEVLGTSSNLPSELSRDLESSQHLPEKAFDSIIFTFDENNLTVDEMLG